MDIEYLLFNFSTHDLISTNVIHRKSYKDLTNKRNRLLVNVLLILHISTIKGILKNLGFPFYR